MVAETEALPGWLAQEILLTEEPVLWAQAMVEVEEEVPVAVVQVVMAQLPVWVAQAVQAVVVQAVQAAAETMMELMVR